MSLSASNSRLFLTNLPYISTTMPRTLNNQHPYPFGLMMSGRSWSEGYRFGFNGKENTTEVYGNGNVVDFGARMFDARLGRWLSVDPLKAKYPAISAFAYAYNSPLTFTDPDGADNVIYLVVLPSAMAYINMKEIQQSVQWANSNFMAMGVQTRVILATDVVGYNVYAFDPNNTGIDATDAIAVLGESTDVVSFIKNYDPEFWELLNKNPDWGSKGNYNPGFSENQDGSSPNTKKGGSWIAIDAAELDRHGNYIGETLEKGTAIVINHEVGHLAGLDHHNRLDNPIVKKPGDPGYTDSPIMKEPDAHAKIIKTSGYDYLTSNNSVELKRVRGLVTHQNQDYRSAFRDRFGTNESQVNYEK